ncbi:MAG: leucyl aminopeptidase [Deltaproteobacteria bacterium]|nr:leucyl aminopeptidase [Deltaproteobacteria bacterium]
MKLSLQEPSLKKISGVLALPVLDGKLHSHSLAKKVDQALGGLLSSFIKKTEFKGRVAEVENIATHGKIGAFQVLLVGLGKGKKLEADDLRRAAAASAKAAERLKSAKLYSALSLIDHDWKPEELAQILAEGTVLSTYRFDKFKGKKDPKSHLAGVEFLLSAIKEKAAFARGLKLGQVGAEGALYARDLVNTPSHNKPPEVLGLEAKKLKGVRTRVWKHQEIKKMGMGALYGVGMGSTRHPPVFIEMHYKPKTKAKKTIAVVGKGITFDSGGLSLKPPKYMETMKDDMAGAAAVLGLMKILPQLNPKVEVYGYISSAENMPGGGAQRPGDVVKAYNGKTIEVLNTDAEGRLALADALSYIGKHRKVDYIIDMATLTGAALVALGDLVTAALGTDEALIKKIQKAGDFTGEKVWELPLEERYWEDFKSEVADMRNIGGLYAGTINGALFLKQFVPEKTKWVHLDIAGPSWANKPWTYCPVGGTGIMVRTLARLLEDF